MFPSKLTNFFHQNYNFFLQKYKFFFFKNSKKNSNSTLWTHLACFISSLALVVFTSASYTWLSIRSMDSPCSDTITDRSCRYNIYTLQYKQFFGNETLILIMKKCRFQHVDQKNKSEKNNFLIFSF